MFAVVRKLIPPIRPISEYKTIISLMTAMNQIVAAIDIGTAKIVAVAGKREPSGRIKILGYGLAESRGVVRGSVQNIGEVASAVRQAVDLAEQSSKVQFKNVFVGIAGQNIRGEENRHSKVIDSTDGIISQTDVNQLVDQIHNISFAEGEEILHVIPQNYSVDNNPVGLQPVGCSGKKLEGSFHVVIGKASSIKNLRAAVTKAGLNVIRFVLEPLASAEAVLTADEKEAGVLLADIGGGTTDMALFMDSVLRSTAVVPFGGNSVTSDIKTGCSILLRQAELLKIQYGSALSMNGYEHKTVSVKGITGRNSKEIILSDLANIINARMEEIIGGMAYELDNSHFENQISAGVVITGGAALLKNLPQLIKFNMGHDVRLGSPSAVLCDSSDIFSPQYSTAVGLVIKGFEYLDKLKETRSFNNQINDDKQNDKSDVSNSDNDNNSSTDKQKDSRKKEGFLKRFVKDIFDEPKDSAM